MHSHAACVIAVLLPLAGLGFQDAGQSAALMKQAADAWKAGERDKALELASKAIKADPDVADYSFLRGTMYEMLNKHAEAIADFSRAIQLDPKNAEAYDHRGSEQFKLGKIAESVADFDQYLKLKPNEFPMHWKRGTSLFYAGRYADGKKQFEGYEKVDTNDVENAVWHFLCNAKLVGVEKARGEVLKIGKDRRVPMMEVYELYQGKCKPEDVLAAARAGTVNEELRSRQLFYAHLYLGIYYDVLGDKKQALEHLALAANKYRISHYMGDVAHVHEQILRKEKK